MSRTAYILICTVFALFILLMTEWTFSEPVYSREYCVRPPYMRSTVDCTRIPTIEKPLCPYP